ncbi:armadillo-type protein [Catenaria anguillulae PL171]|uniref:Armadillo-type protein n=1 Tax=Catenaria anguillulae PL171 TaxID=765915 RepID=A0A1Y2H8S8_9FUNG|nr:armadillo-type protein [Catenaria anguillulae PL171]
MSSNSSATAAAINSLFDKISNPDADFRYMALTDLHSALSQDMAAAQLDQRIEPKLLAALYQLLADSNSGVKNMAVKCLGPLVTKLSPKSLADLVDKLAHMLTQAHGDDASIRDVVLMALRLVYTELAMATTANGEQVAMLAMGSIHHLLTGLPHEQTENIQSDMLDAVADLLAKFGKWMAKLGSPTLRTAPAGTFIATLRPQLVHILQTGRPALRKRAGQALANLLPLLPATDASAVVLTILGDIQPPHASVDDDTLRTHLGALTTMVKDAASGAVAPHVGALMDALVGIIDKDQEADELREAAVQTLDALLVRYTGEAGERVPRVLVGKALELVQYDPNYAYDEDEEGDRVHTPAEGEGEDEDMADASDEDGAGDDDDDDYGQGYSDDDDMTWKVRRAAARLLSTIIATRPDLAHVLVSQVGPVLTRRFEEREEGVRNEVLQTYAALLRMATADAGTGAALLLKSHRAMFHRRFAKYVLVSKDASSRQVGFAVLRQALDAFDWSKTRNRDAVKWAEAVARAMNVGQGATTTAAATTMVGSLGALATSLKLESLAFLGAWLHSLAATPGILPRGVVEGDLCRALLAGMQDSYYKVAAESLAVAQHFVPMLATHGLASQLADMQRLVQVTLANANADEEVKERALSLFGLMIATLPTFADSAVTAQAEDGWASVLMKRLTNEVSRLAATKVVVQIVRSTTGANVAFLIPALVAELVPNLRKNPRALREATLVALTAVLARYPAQVSMDQAQLILDESGALISDQDLLLASQALKTAAGVLAAFPALLPAALTPSTTARHAGVIPAALDLIQSPLVQSTQTLVALLDLLATATRANPAARTLYDRVAALEPKQPAAQAKAVAAVLRASTLDAMRPAGINNGQFVLDVFASGDADDVLKSSAAYALGCMAVGNPGAYLPVIVQGIQGAAGGAAAGRGGANARYLMLHALKQVLTSASDVPALHTHLAGLWEPLFSLAAGGHQGVEEGARLLVGECIGKLALLAPDQFLVDMHAKLTRPGSTPEMRVTVMGAIKYVFAHATTASDKVLAPLLADFFAHVGDADLAVRRASLAAAQSAAHGRAHLVRPVLDTLLPLILAETKVRPELIREVIMGPFKHKIDDGLETRKLAFECISTLLSTCASAPALRPVQLLDPIISGLKDQHEVQLLAYLALAKLAAVAPLVVGARVDELPDVVQVALFPKVKQDMIKQDADRQKELVRAALRSLVAVIKATEGVTATTTAVGGSGAPVGAFAQYVANLKTGQLAADYQAAELAVQSVAGSAYGAGSLPFDPNAMEY